jgi:TM2 domain-containing membrane protein YozV
MAAKQQAPVQASGGKPVNWVLTLIMSILFGSLGVDRFIMGHIGLGILKLVTLGGCGIWWLIDVILIATKHPFKGVEWVVN